MNRPTAALACAALAAVALGLGVSYAACPVRTAELSVSAPSRVPSSATESKTQGELHTVREYPVTQGELVSPFLPEHPTREQSRALASTASPKPKPGAELSRQPSSTLKEEEIRLVGVISSENERRAILSVGKRQILLAPGEEKDGVTLGSLTENTATVSTAMGEWELSLSRANYNKS